VSSYFLVKQVHVLAVFLSFTLFFLRGLWMLADSPRLRHSWVRITPRVVDTVLLGSGAIALTLLLGQYPLQTTWLTAKVVALAVYICLGMVALKRGKTKRARTIAWICALLVFAYIVAVAHSHDPIPFALNT
jgi:uncharacterized membrane protein SirB2